MPPSTPSSPDLDALAAQIAEALCVHGLRRRAWHVGSVLFYEADDPNGIHSNTHPSAIVDGGELWTSAEAIYQASRHDDDWIRQRIRLARDALEAKRISRERIPSIAAKTLATWTDRKVVAMARANLLRATQDAAFRAALLASEGREIVELAPADDFWGAVERRGRISGANVLGRIQMAIRALLAQDLLAFLAPKAEEEA